MKRAAILLTAILSATASAEDDFCTNLASISEGIMTRHQLGRPMAETLAIGADAPAEGKRIIDSIVTEAYSHPRYSTEQMQLREIGEFRDAVHVECVRSIDGD